MERKHEFLKTTDSQHLIICVSRLTREKNIEELLQAMTQLPNCALWLVGDGNHRCELEQISAQSNAASRVKFWGYQKGKALHAAYAVADVFVCPSLTETFGQTVNEALASEVKVALPRVSVFVEAYGECLPSSAYWQPNNLKAMVETIRTQLNTDRLPDRSKLKSWNRACLSLLKQYHTIQVPAEESLWFLSILPLWWLLTFLFAICLCVVSAFSLMRHKSSLPSN